MSNVSLIFKDLKEKLRENFDNNSGGHDYLFEIAIDKDLLWEHYLDSFPRGSNEIYRERREMDCSSCKQFIRAFGNVVFIEENRIKSIWDFKIDNPIFQEVIDSMSKFIYSNYTIKDVYISDTSKIGVDKNYEQLEDGSVKEWHHFYLKLPERFVHKSRTLSIDTLKSRFRDRRNVFKRSLEEISSESINEVLELISSNSLYKGEEWKKSLEDLLSYQEEYNNLSLKEQTVYLWRKAVYIGDVLGKIRNHSIGTLLTDLTNGVELDEAVRKYESIVAPTNYKRPKAIFSKRMLNDAKDKISELGYLDSLKRRFANIQDISVENILFIDRDTSNKLSSDVFEEMEKDIVVDPKKYSRVEEITIDKFIEDVLPTANKLELLVENKHINNFVSLIAPENKEAPSMFKWNNPFSWAYNGNITDSIKQRVKELGGSVDGDLNFRLAWNFPEEQYDNADLDNHCNLPNGKMIFFENKRQIIDGGKLDVDIIDPKRGELAVENITFAKKEEMLNGDHTFFIRCYNKSGGAFGFRAELEIEGNKYEFDYPHELRQKEDVKVCTVTHNDGKFTVKEHIPSALSNREVWNLKSNQFVPVEMMMYSPNHWDNEKSANKHFMFMLEDCKNPETPNGFYNEFLKQDLITHKRFFEALGSKMKVDESDNQLSGLGFSSTQRNNVLIKVIGHTERILNVKI